MEEAREQIQNWRKEQETNHQRCKERWGKNPQGPNRPTPWHFVPTEPPKPENEQSTSETSETENEDDNEFKETLIKTTETDAERASRMATQLMGEWNNTRSSKETERKNDREYHDANPGKCIYNPYMRVRNTNHCECLPRVWKQDPKLDWKTCPGYHKHLNNRNQEATQQALKEAEEEKEKRNTPAKMKKSTSQNLTIKQQLIPRHKTVGNK